MTLNFKLKKEIILKSFPTLLKSIINSLTLFLANVNVSSSVRLSSVCLSFVTFVLPTQAIEIFGNVSMPFGTLAIHNLSLNNFAVIVPGAPLRRGS